MERAPFQTGGGGGSCACTWPIEEPPAQASLNTGPEVQLGLGCTAWLEWGGSAPKLGYAVLETQQDNQ